MMTNDINPWAKMSTSSQRRIDFQTQHNLFWVKDFHGNYGFCLQSMNGFDIDENTIRLRGISILKRNTEKGIVELFLILSKKEDWEIFLTLCEDLVAVTKNYHSDIEMICAIENRLKRWQQLLKQEKSQELTIEKQMGLFSELLCLRDFVAKRAGIKQSIISWVGPESDKQDFLLEDIVIEVKSHRTSKGDFAHISSQLQLNSEKEPLYLFSYALTPSENGLSIEDISKSIRMQINRESNDLIYQFENKLMEYGYFLEFNKESLQKFIVDKLKVFHVSDTFPKISVKDIRSQIVAVKYTIDLSQCSDYEVEIQSL
ncbi:MAG: hypothetical protein JM58_05265 [Peptococcaceae bacterium BICA1-8]|nr:MAG: hypothetical protein JM58_05265 [Peptococcaceae bacterium BICA1-8]